MIKYTEEVHKTMMIFVAAHIITIAFLWFFGVVHLLWIIPISLLIYNLGYSVYAHRIYTHNQFKLSPLGHTIGHVLYLLTNSGIIAGYAAFHMQHHQYSGTDKDVHEWRENGFWRTFFGLWHPNFKMNKRILVKKMREPRTKFFTKHHYHILIPLMILFAPVVALSFYWRQFGVIFVHMSKGDGTTQRKNKEDTSENVWFLKPVMWGDELHLNHHNNMARANLGDGDLRTFDLLYYLGKAWEKI